MTDKLLCPYCEKPLHCGAQLDSDGHIIELYQCANPECESTEFLVGCREFWDILGQHRRTRKALDIAVVALKKTLNGCESYDADYGVCYTALEQITALNKGGDNE